MHIQNDAVWRRLFELAAEIYALAPWQRYEETDVFGVQHPVTGVTDFVSFMGALGTHTSVALYLGAEGWHGFWAMQKTAPKPETRPEEVLEVAHLQLAFGPRDELLPHENAILKRLGLKVPANDAWPMFRSYSAGLYPWLLTPEEQARLLPALLQVVAMHRELDEKLGDRYMGPDEPCLVRVQDPQTEQWRDEWRIVKSPKPPVWAAVIPEMQVEAARALPQTRQTLEADVFMTMQPMQEAEGERPYWPYLLAVMDAESLFALKPHLLIAKPSFHYMLEQAPAAFIESMIHFGHRPAVLRVRTPRMAALFRPLAKQLGIQVRTAKRLPAIEDFRTRALEMLSNPGR